jgi:hypothetical protein
MLRPLKLLKRVVLGLIILVIIAIVAVLLLIDPLAKAAVEKGTSYALQVDASVGDVDVGVWSGELTMDNLRIGNPAGYQTPHLLDARRFELSVRPMSVFGSTVEVRKFLLDGLDFNVEQKPGETNVSRVIRNASRLGGPDKEGQEPPDEGGKKVKVNHILIRNVVARVQLLPVGGEAATLVIEVPQIELKDVSPEDAPGLAISELTRRLLPAILAAVLEKGRADLPKDLHDSLSRDAAGLAQLLGADATKLVAQVGGRVEQLLKRRLSDLAGKDASKAVEDAGKLLDLPGAIQGTEGK